MFFMAGAHFVEQLYSNCSMKGGSFISCIFENAISNYFIQKTKHHPTHKHLLHSLMRKLYSVSDVSN